MLVRELYTYETRYFIRLSMWHILLHSSALGSLTNPRGQQVREIYKAAD